MCYCPTTYPTPKVSPHRRLCISTFPKKTSPCMIYKRFEKWGHGSMSENSPSPCNTCVIPVSLYIYVLICHKNANANTPHTHHTQQRIRLLSYLSRGTVMSYTDHSVQRCFKSKHWVCHVTSMTRRHGNKGKRSK